MTSDRTPSQELFQGNLEGGGNTLTLEKSPQDALRNWSNIPAISGLSLSSRTGLRSAGVRSRVPAQTSAAINSNDTFFHERDQIQPPQTPEEAFKPQPCSQRAALVPRQEMGLSPALSIPRETSRTCPGPRWRADGARRSAPRDGQGGKESPFIPPAEPRALQPNILFFLAGADTSTAPPPVPSPTPSPQGGGAQHHHI